MCLRTHQNIVIGGQSIVEVNGTKVLVVVTDKKIQIVIYPETYLR